MSSLILLPLAAELPTTPVLDAALSLAWPLEGQVQALYIRPDADAAITTLPDVIIAAGVTRDAIDREGRQAAAAAKGRFDEWRNRGGASALAGGGPGSWTATWSEQVGEFEPLITRFGRLSDFIVLPRPTAREVVAQRCFDAAVFGTGRPTLLVGDAAPGILSEHILIAWNGSLEASRAVFAAMPLLRQAKRISVFTAPEYGAEAVDLDNLAASFRDRGIRTPEVIFPQDGSVAAALVTAAQTHHASLIVMGAYTHSRLRESFLGGVTRQLLADAPVPLLMSH